MQKFEGASPFSREGCSGHVLFFIKSAAVAHLLSQFRRWQINSKS